MHGGWWSCRAASTCTATSSGPRSTRRGKCVPSKNAAASRALALTDAQRHDGKRAQHVCDRIQVRGAGLYDRVRRGDSPAFARHAHEEFADTPCIDKGFYILMGNNQYLMRSIQQEEPRRSRRSWAGCSDRRKSYAAKIVNPGGVEVWKNHPSGNVADIDSPVDHFGVTPRQIIARWPRRSTSLHLPHPVHIHANNLGLPGNWTTTLETMKVLEGHRGHMTHIQFHSYGGGAGNEDTFSSKVARARRLRERPPQPDGRRGAGDLRRDDQHDG